MPTIGTNEIYLLNSATNEVAYIQGFSYENSVFNLYVSKAKDLATLQTPTEWDIIKYRTYTIEQQFSQLMTGLADNTKSINYNVIKVLYDYLLTLDEFVGYSEQILI